MINWIQENSKKLFDYIFFGMLTIVFAYNSNNNTRMVNIATQSLVKTAEQTSSRSIQNQNNITSISTLLGVHIGNDINIESRVDTLEIKLKRNNIR